MHTIPITVVGGYLGAGKTTLVNAVLRHADRRIGVVVNDFGEVGLDAQLIEAALDQQGADEVPVVNLANGCVCCTLGDDLHTTLQALASLDPPLDHIVVEASGVADPVATAAWGTVAPFAPGGVVVAAAADSIRKQSVDRYVGSEVVRQLVGADLVVLTKVDLCAAPDVLAVEEWLAASSSAPVVHSVVGNVPLDVLLGVRSAPITVPAGTAHDEAQRYVRWSIEFRGVRSRRDLDAFLGRLPVGLLRLKGLVTIEDSAEVVVVQVVGAGSPTVSRFDGIREESATRAASRIEAIGIRGVLDDSDLDDLAAAHLQAT